ncbi:Acyl-CoA dehydrogenase [Salinihabitans flavidus]|uniref:Acyl-CoA dehydrogenase n=1 Tax=Salinihabitans flavidus TaxID=569882 RepID=A0A1H8UJQ2_9RHOB|nr:acyl-CoA dehydrogenase family protein [Salinihabitans flavidus]SEP03449.1 Acyl-CoA dehydrogenase [Salinihabitans flavidus]
MRYAFSRSDTTFRDDVRGFLTTNLPEDIARKTEAGQRLDKADFQRWEKILATRNWLTVGWPAEQGGPGFTPTQRYLFEQEYSALPTPRLKQFGIGMVGPVIYTFGSEKQKRRFLPGIRESRDWWCQGFSEPGAGSDLASLRTLARREGDHYVVTGQKVWTTYAQWADWMFCLVRTDPDAKKQTGITFLLIDMKSPGVTVRQIPMMDGDKELNEVFLDNVRVPMENRVGDENHGWTYAKFLLSHERLNMSNAARSRRQLTGLVAQARSAPHPLAVECDRVAMRLATLDVELTALELMELRILSALNVGRDIGTDAAKLKLRGTEITQALSRLALEIAGADALTLDQEWLNGSEAGEQGAALAEYLNLRKLSIWGGSNEIQRTILARSLLDL